MILALACAPAFLILLLPAFFNGFPLVYSDSGTYLDSAMARALPVDRPVHYSLFLYALHGGRSLWPVVAAQSALTVAVVGIFVQAALGRIPRLHLALLLSAVAALTALPTFVSQIMPDLFTPLLLVSLVTLGLHSARLTMTEEIFLHAVVLLSVCVHQANLVIAAPVLLLLCLMRARGRHARAKIACTLAAGLALLLLPAALTTRTLGITRGSSVFLLGKLMDDGIALDYLTGACVSQTWPVCEQVPAIRTFGRENPGASMSEFFLWGGPLEAAGGSGAVAKYASSINAACIALHPLAFVAQSTLHFGRQLLRVATGDGIEREGPEMLIVTTLQTRFPEAVYAQFSRSRQQSGSLHFAGLSGFHLAILACTLAALFALARSAFRLDPQLCSTVALLLFGVAANAFVLGALSGVHDRYQSRVAWLLVLAALLLAYRQFTPQPQASAPDLLS